MSVDNPLRPQSRSVSQAAGPAVRPSAETELQMTLAAQERIQDTSNQIDQERAAEMKAALQDMVSLRTMQQDLSTLLAEQVPLATCLPTLSHIVPGRDGGCHCGEHGAGTG